MPADQIRTFIALEINPEVKERVSAIQDQIKRSGSLQGKWVAKENLHLTLKFLGDTQLNQIEEIKLRLQQCCDNQKAIDCQLAQIGVFPNDRYPRVIWAGLESDAEQIKDLARRIEKSLRQLRFNKEKKEFKNHITFCRPKQVLSREQFKLVLDEINRSFQPQRLTIDKVTLFESNLTPQGPIYTNLSSVMLKIGSD